MNLFWPVYKNLELEVLEIAKYIHVSDKQVGVYSMRIADIIVRCAIEIEAISKELYKSLGGCMELKDKEGKKRDIYFDTDCLKLLEKHWKLSKKVVKISSPLFYLEEERHKVICPLHNAFKRKGAKWNKAYQAIKHNRAESLESSGTIENMLLALGALYILNLYYKDDSFIMQDKVESNVFDERIGSELFSVTFAVFNSVSALDDYEAYIDKGKHYETAIYIKRYEKESFEKIKHSMDKMNEIAFQTFSESMEGKQLLTRKIINQEPIPPRFWTLVEEAGGKDLQQKIEASIRLESSKLANIVKNLTYEYVLNK